MSRYIKFDDAVKVMACEMYAEAQSQGYDVDGIEDFMPEAKAWLNDAPSIDIEPKHGEWEWISSTYDRTPCRKTYMCSCCRHEIITFDVEPWEHYCPHCGAKMDGERKENE